MMRWPVRAWWLAWLTACAAPTLGHGGRGVSFAELESRLRPGFDDKKSVLTLLGKPQRSVQDAAGREIYFYYWADGEGQGERVVIAFNTNGVVYLVDAGR